MKKTTSTPSDLKHYSVSQAAKKLNVSIDTLRRWEASGKLASIRTSGGHRRYDPSSLTTLKLKKYDYTPTPAVFFNSPSSPTPTTFFTPSEILSTSEPSDLSIVSSLYRDVLPPSYKRILRLTLSLLVFLGGIGILSKGVFSSPSFNLFLASTPLSFLSRPVSPLASSGTYPRVLQAASTLLTPSSLNVNIDASFKQDVEILGSLTASGAAIFASDVDVLGTLTTNAFNTIGNITAGGDIAANGGDFTSTATIFNLLSGVTTLNIGGASTTITLGVAGGTTTLASALNVDGATTLDSTLAVTGKLTASGDLAVSGTTTLGGSLTVSGGALSVNGVSYTFPSTQGSGGSSLINNGSGTLTWGSATSDLGSVTGVLGIANGGTNNSAAYTAGSVIFSDGTKLTSDSTNFFFDDGSNFLGLGTNTPSTTLDVLGTTRLSNNTASNSVIDLTSTGDFTINDAGTPFITFNSNGNVVLADNHLLDLSSVAHDDSTPQGLRLPQASSFTNLSSGEGYLAWNSGTNTLMTFDGSSWNAIAGGSLFTDGGAITYLTSTTDDLALGGTTAESPFFVDVSASALHLNPFGVASGNTGELRLEELEANGDHYTGFKAPNSLVASVVYALPTADATVNNQVLASNTAGQLAWIDVSSGAGSHWTSTGAIVHLVNNTDDFALGGSTTEAPLFFDVSQAALHLNPFGAASGNTGEFRLEELEAGGDNYTGFKAPDALAGNVVYTLPTLDATLANQVLASNGTGTLSWIDITGGANSPFSKSSTNVYLTTTTDELIIGGSSPLSSAKVSIDGDSDQIQFLIQGFGTQTTNLATFEQSDGTDVFSISNAGNLTMAGLLDVNGTGTHDIAGTLNLSGNALTSSGDLTITPTGGDVTIAGNLAINGTTTIGDASGDTLTANAATWTFANDTNFVLSGGVNGLSLDTTTLSIDATNDRVGIGTIAPTSMLHVVDATTTSGSVITATASAITSGNILNLGQGGNTNFTGNVIFADIDNTGGGTFSGNFLRFNNSNSTITNISSGGNITTAGTYAGTSGTNTRLQATGTTTGSTGNSSIYFLDSAGTTRGRFDTLGTFGTGADGAMTITTATSKCDSAAGDFSTSLCRMINITAVASAGTNSVTVASTTGYAAGDEILLIQMTGTGAGNYETKLIESVDSTNNIFYFGESLTKTYQATNAQIARIPQFTTFTVNTGVTFTPVAAWNGTTGGVFYLKASTSATVNGTGIISMNSLGGAGAAGSTGAAGGAGAACSSGSTGATGTSSSAGATGTGPGGGGGGGAATAGNGGKNGGTNNNFTGGGGGGASGGGGAGGSLGTAASSATAGANGGNGGNGGDTGAGGGNKGTAGTAGASLGTSLGDSSFGSLYMGSGGGGGSGGAGGGASQCKGGAGTAASGGNGGNGGNGGIGGGILVITSQTITNSGTLRANGSGGSNGSSGSDGIAGTGNSSGGGGAGGSGGAGGGGAGGSIWLTGNSVTAGTVTVTGGTAATNGSIVGGNGSGCANTISGTGGGGGGGANGTGGSTGCNVAGNAAAASASGAGSDGTSGRTLTTTANNYGILHASAVDLVNADLAEHYATGDKSINEGDVVSVSNEKILDDGGNEVVTKGVLRKATTQRDPHLLGIISTAPGIVLGSSDEASPSGQTRILALSGRVPVKIASSSASIKIGDLITSSSVPGYAQKLSGTGPFVAKALENWEPSGGDRIEAFVTLGFSMGTLTDTGELQSSVTLVSNDVKVRLTLGDRLKLLGNQILGISTPSGSDSGTLASSAGMDMSLPTDTSISEVLLNFSGRLDSLSSEVASISSYLGGSVLGASVSANLISTPSGILASFGTYSLDGRLSLSDSLFLDPTTYSLDSSHDLHLQLSNLGSTYFQANKIQLDPQGNLNLTTGHIIGNDSMRGSVTLSPGFTSIHIDQSWDEIPSSLVTTPSYNTATWTQNRSLTGFSINVASPSSTLQTIDWIAFW